MTAHPVPSEKRVPAGPCAQTPVVYRTLNGYELRPVPLAVEEVETEALRVRRLFEVRAPSGETCRCAVDLTTSVRGVVRDVTGQDYPADHRIWDLVCRTALVRFLVEKASLPPGLVLVYGLTRDQLQAAGTIVGGGADFGA